MITTLTPQITPDLICSALKVENGFFVNMPRHEVEESRNRYGKFLELVLAYPDRALAPSKDIDEMWHLHMLHPVDYYNDCIANFGAIMDHDGGFGAASPEEWGQLTALFDETARLWETHFGEEYVSKADAGTNCRKACAKCAVKCRTACGKKDGK